MIIKIKGFKTPAYGTLLNYILNDSDRLFDASGKSFLMSRNLKGNDISGWVAELRQNESRRINHRKNQLYLTHEILSWHRQDSNKITLAKMSKIVREYMRLRGGDRAVWVAAPHFDQKHFHCHILVGAVDRAGKSMRMSHAELNELKEKAQAYYIEKYPELGRSVVRHGRKKKSHSTDKEYQMKLHTGRATSREEITELVNSCVRQTLGEEALVKMLSEVGIKVYRRGGKIVGIIAQERKFRFKSLGIQTTTQRNGRGISRRITDRYLDRSG